MSPQTAARHSRVFRVFRFLGRAVVGLLVFVAALVTAVLCCLDLPPVRRFAVKEVNGILAPMFAGKVTITRLGHLGLDGVRGVDADIDAPDGARVVTVRGAAAFISPVTLVKRAVFGKGDRDILIDSVVVDAVDADVETKDDGSLKLLTAFDDRPGTPVTPPDPKARGIAIDFPDVRLTHVWAHGMVAGALAVDADVDGVKAGLYSGSTKTKVDVWKLALLARSLPVGIELHSDVEAHLAMPSATGKKMDVHAKLHNLVGQVPVNVELAMDGDAIDAALDVPEVAGASVRASVQGAPVYSTVAAHGEAHGTLDELTTTLHARLGTGSLDVDGVVHAAAPLRAKVNMEARHIDVRTFSETAPATDLGAKLVAFAETQADQTHVAHVTLDVLPGTAAGQLVPHIGLHAEASQRVNREGQASTIVAHVEGMADEPGAPVAFTADARSAGGISDVTFGVKTEAPRMEAVSILGDLGTGQLEVAVAGHARVAAAITFEAEVTGAAHRVVTDSARVEGARFFARAVGTPTDPTLEAHVVAQGIGVGGYTFSGAEVSAAGTLSQLFVTASALDRTGPSVKLSTELVLKPALSLRGTRIDLSRGADALDVAVDSARVASGGIEVLGLALDGIGQSLRGSFRGRRGALAVHAESQGIDLAKLAYVAGQDAKIGGNLALNVNLDLKRDYAKGKVSIDLTKGSFGNLRGAEGHVDLALDDRRVGGQLRASLGDAGGLELKDVDVHVGGRDAMDIRSWKRAWGSLAVKADLDVAKVVAMLPADTLPVTDVAGRVTVDGEVKRESLTDLTPEIRLAVVTRGLTATGRSTAPRREPNGPLMVGPATWMLYGMDLDGSLVIDGAESAGELAVRVLDKEGALVALDVKTAPLPFAELLAGDASLASKLQSLAVAARIEMPVRELQRLPLLIRPDGLHGRAGMTVTVEGTSAKPVIDVEASTQNLTVASARDTVMTGDLKAHYDGSLMTVSAKVQSKEKPLLDANVEVHALAADLVAAHDGDFPWQASAKASLAKFPLGTIAVLSDDKVQGFVSGDVEVTGIHEHGHAVAKLSFDGLALGDAKFKTANIDATLDDGGLDAKARFDSRDGFLEANAKMGMKWGTTAVPSSDGSGVKATLKARHFPASAAAPFATAAISKLSGWLDADANATLVPNQKPQMSGSVTFSDGVLETPAIGEEFRHVKAKITLTPDGVVKLDDTEASGLSGKVTLSGSAHLDGTTLLSADLAMKIPKGDAIPLDVQGTNLGTVFGDVTVKATGSPDGKAIKVAVDVPGFHVNLPDASLPRAPQGLADAQGVHVGVYRDTDRFNVLATDGAPVDLVAQRNAVQARLPVAGGVPPVQPPSAGEAEARKADAASTELDVTVKLGDIQILRGQQVAINVDGNLTATIAAATKVRGQIHVKSGKLEVQSKEFDIEKGTVSFVGDDPSNPEINVTAGWTAPDGTHVLADYIGPVKTGKVTLRSEPPRPKNEIVSLILFGSADGSSSTPYASKSPSTGTQAGTTVGGLATDGLSKGLDQLTGMNVTAKIDTSDSANPRPEVELQIAKDISLELAVVLGTPPPGTNPDTTYATIDWRFVRNWSLATTFGDAGSTFADIVWQYRY